MMKKRELLGRDLQEIREVIWNDESCRRRIMCSMLPLSKIWRRRRMEILSEVRWATHTHKIFILRNAARKIKLLINSLKQ